MEETAIKKRILIVEDEKPMAGALQLKLNSAGYDSVAFHNGLDAIPAIEKEKFDCILLDLVMPKLDGFGVLQRVKELGVTTPVIVMSNLSQEEDEGKAKEMGAVDYLVKSDTPIVQIVEKIKQIVG